MASSYVAIEFRARGPEQFHSRVVAIDAVPATDLIDERSRELAWYERDSLLGSELACRVVLWIHDAIDETEVARAQLDEDPYRKLEIVDVVYRIPHELGVLLERLDAECSIVEGGRLRFTTRRYEAAVRDQLAADIEAAAGRLAKVELGVERQRLIGRIEGAIVKIHELEQLVRRSGLVDFDEVVVDYQ